MAKQTINIGTAANSKNGDPLRTAFTKTNANFTELYNGAAKVLTNLTLTNHALSDKYFVSGSEVSFEHTDGGTEVDEIDTGLSITRGVIRGIYNPEEEEAYDNSTHLSPVGTEWNREGWNDLENVKNRTFDTWRDTVQNNPPESIGKELVMHDTVNDKYYAIKFTKWSIGDDGGEGGFAYIRTLIDVNQFFVHTAGGDEVDVIDTGLSITRDGNQGIYNPEAEEEYDNSTYLSPVGTLWNLDGGWSDLSDLQTRVYLPWRAAVLQNPPSSVGKEMVMKDTINNEYYAIRFTEWGQQNGGSFAYHRRLIDKDQIPEGVKFADGSIITSYSDVIDIPRTHDGVRAGGGVKYLDQTDRGRFVHYYGEDGHSDLIVPSQYENPLSIGFTATIVLDDFNNNKVYIYSNDSDVTIFASGQDIYNTRNWYIGGSGNAGVYTLMKIGTNRWVLTGPEITWDD